MNRREQYLTIGLAAALLLATVAGASAYINQDALTRHTATTKVKSSASNQNLPWLDKQHEQRRAAPQQVASAQPQCNDGNILGTVAGGVAGGALSSTIGNGNGKTAATIAGALGGAYLGNQYIPLQNSTCR